MEENKIESISMMLITYAGLAKSAAMYSIDMAEEGKFSEAEELLKEANENLILAGKEHFKAMQLDLSGELKLNLLFIHSEDQMSNAEIVITLARKFIKIWKKLSVNHIISKDVKIK